MRTSILLLGLAVLVFGGVYVSNGAVYISNETSDLRGSVYLKVFDLAHWWELNYSSVLVVASVGAEWRFDCIHGALFDYALFWEDCTNCDSALPPPVKNRGTIYGDLVLRVTYVGGKWIVHVLWGHGEFDHRVYVNNSLLYYKPPGYGGNPEIFGEYHGTAIEVRLFSLGDSQANAAVLFTALDPVRKPLACAVALARLSVSAVDQTGGSPPIKLLLDGKEVAGDAWLAGGSYLLEAPPEVRMGDVRWVFERWSDGATTSSRRVELTENLELRAFYKLQYYIYFKTPWRTVEGWFDRGVELEAPGGDVEEGDWRYRFRGWSGSGCPLSGRFVVLGPARCEAVYVKEYRVVVKLFSSTETHWVEEGVEFRKEVWAEVERGVRHVPTGVDGCNWTRAQDRVVLSARGPARCVISWQRKYSVRIETGIDERPLFWEGWLPEGSVIRYVEDNVLMPSGNGLSVAVVEGPGVRYKPAGWSCNGVEAAREVAVDAPLRCVGLWRREVQVVVEVYLDGLFKERRELWVAQGDTLRLNPLMFTPQSSPLAPAKFAGWEDALGDAGGELTLRPETPVAIRVKFYTDYTPLYVAIGGIAVAVVLGVFFHVRRRGDRTRIWAKQPTETKEEIEIEPIEETKAERNKRE